MNRFLGFIFCFGHNCVQFASYKKFVVLTVYKIVPKRLNYVKYYFHLLSIKMDSEPSKNV